MAPLVTEQQPQQDYPYFWSRPTQQPRPNQAGLLSGEAIGKGLSEAGSAIREGTQGITQAYEKGIQNAIYAGVDPLRDEYMKRLHDADQVVQGRETPDPLGRDAPRDVKQLPNSLDTLDSARANGKLSQTDYDARLTALAKEIRGKYPGFRQYVDEEFKRVTGRDSANQYIRSVIQDIDSFIAQRNNKRDKFETELYSQAIKYPEGSAVIQAYEKDPSTRTAAMNWLNDRMAHEKTLAIFNEENRAIEGTEKVSHDNAVRDFHEKAGQTSDTAWSPSRSWIFITSGMTGDVRKQKALQALEEHDSAELAKYSKEELASLATNLNMWGEAIKTQRTKELRGVANKSVTDKEIEDQVNAEYNTRMKPLIDALAKPDIGLATNLKMLMDGADADTWSMVQREDPQLYNSLQFIAGARKADPELYKALTQRPEYQDLVNRYQTLVTKHRTAMAQTPGSPNAMTGDQVFRDQDQKHVDDGRVQRLTVEFMALAGKKEISPDTRMDIFRNSFSDSSDVLKYFAKEQYAPGSIKPYLGQQWVFDQLTSDKMITEGEKFGKLHPEAYDNFRRFAETSVQYLLTDWTDKKSAPMLTLHQKESLARRKGFATEGMSPEELTYESETAPLVSPKITATYNDQNHEFTFRDQKGRISDRPDLQGLSRNLSRLQEVVAHDPNNPKVEGGVALYNFLKSQNAEPGSMVDLMMQAMKIARGQ